MGIFKKDDKKQEKKIIIKPKKHALIPPIRKQIPIITAREYRLFKKYSKKKKNWYEKLAGASEKILKKNPGKKMQEDLEKAIDFTGLQITPGSVMSLFICTILFFSVVGAVAMISGFIPLNGSVMIILFGFLLGYYFYKYPLEYVKEVRIKASSQIVLAILYMVVSMRISPNLERALRFAASNITGPLAIDLRKLLWDIEMRKYSSAWDAMDSYIKKWKVENEEFAEALRLIRESTMQIPERAEKVLDQALDTVLEGSKTRMKHYTQDLKTPVMVIHMMGIILPVLGTIMAPLAAVFMSDIAKPEYFILGYNILLPIVLIWFINSTLKKRPITFSPTQLSKTPNMPKKGEFLVNGKTIPAFPIALIVLLVFLMPSVVYFVNNPNLLFGGMKAVKGNVKTMSLLMSSLITIGLAASLAIYFFLSTFQRKSLQDDIESMESEFELALFQLGHRVSGGVPVELAIEEAIDDVKDLKISDLFKRTLNNIRNLGMTFKSALFDKQYGALHYYPSKLIRNIMNAVVDTSKKGVKYASDSMLRISNYLKNVRETQEYLRDLLAETTSSMNFQAKFLTPLITGLVVSMADVIVSALAKLGAYIETVGGGQGIMGIDISTIFGGAKNTMTPALFQLIIGIYLLEIIFILAMFLTKISKGENKTLQFYSTAKLFIVGVVLYLVVIFISATMFGGVIEGALSGLGL